MRRRTGTVCLLGLALSCSVLKAEVKTVTTTTVTGSAAAPSSYLLEICALESTADPSRRSLSCTGQVRVTIPVHAYKAPDSPADDESKPQDKTCGGLLPPSPEEKKPPGKKQPAPAKIDFSFIVQLLGNPTPYSVTAQGDHLLIYSSKPQGNVAVLRTLLNRTAEVIGQIKPESSPKPFAVELTIPHAAALGDLASKLQNSNVSKLQVVNIGSGRVRVTEVSGAQDCATWVPFLRSVRRLAWQISPESPVEKLYYLTVTDVKAVVGDGGGSASASPAASGTASADKSTPADSGAASKSAPSSTAGSPGGTGSQGASAGAASTAAGAGTLTISQAAGTTTVTTTPGSSASSGAAGGAGGGAAKGTDASSSSAAPAAKGSDAAAASGGGAKAAVSTVANDLLVFSDPTPGDDGVITEKKRILAALDLPRPEMLINAWVMQNSTTDAHTFGEVSRIVRRSVHEHNEGIDKSIFAGWSYLKNQMGQKGYFNEDFYNYITQKVIFDAGAMVSPAPPADGQYGEQSSAYQSFLNSQGNSARGNRLDGAGEGNRLKYAGACSFNRYCLGYTTLFQPLQPRLTNLLLALMAADEPITPGELLSRLHRTRERSTTRSSSSTQGSGQR